MRSLWSGALNFGLINIPVNLYSGVDSQKLDLDMLHAKDKSPIRYAKVCKHEEVEVPYKEIVKGYKIDDEYVILTDEDFKQASPKKTRMIEIVQFADREEIDPKMFEKPYYLEPGKGADKPYALLREALEKTDKVGIATYVMREHEHLCAVMPDGDALILLQLRFVSEIRSMNDLKLPDVSVRGKEIDMAVELIEKLTETFRPEEFKDTYTNALKRAIRAKAKGKPMKTKEESIPEPTRITDLTALLEQSLKTQRKPDVRRVRS